MKLPKINLPVLLLVTFLISCEGILDVQPESELGTESFLSTEQGINSLLNDSYRLVSAGPQSYMYRLLYSTLSSKIGYGRAGEYEQTTGIPIGNFTWSSNQMHLELWWTEYYQGIRNTNIVIDQLSSGNYSEEFKNVKEAEAKGLRGYFYYELYKLFGPVPIFTSSTPDELERARASDEEIRMRIEQDLMDAAAALPMRQDLFGRVTKGASLGVLAKFYLNTKQWEKTANTAQEIMDLGVYNLVPEYSDIYNHDNEGNEEVVWVVPFLSVMRSSNIIAIITPPDYPLPEGHSTFAARTYAYDWFMDTFPNNDKRKDLIVTEYINTSGAHVQGYGNDQSIWFKYPPDPDATGLFNGIDFMRVRYADILLARAEALNELNGPNQESIELINLIRKRAGVEEIKLGDFLSLIELRSHILNERLWEFYMEGTEREDLIRHEVFISNARAHGADNAQDYHVLFPIPQSEVNANSKIVQNSGY